MVAIECGLCLSGRMRRTARAEVRRWLGGNESKVTGAGRGGKNGSAQLPGAHKLRCIAWRDGGTLASCGPQSVPAPTLVLTPHNPVR